MLFQKGHGRSRSLESYHLISLAERFWAKVDKNGPIVKPELGPCWMWKGAKNDQGYGQIRINHKVIYVHRVVWEFTHDVILDGFDVCHSCDNSICVNPNHLFLGTQLDNMQDAMRKGRVQQGENHWNAVLTVDQVREIRGAYVPRIVSLFLSLN